MVLLINAAFVACCLRIVWTRIIYNRGEDPAPSSGAAAASDEPQPGVAGGGGASCGDSSGAHISMTAVIQPNDEVRQSTMHLLD